MPKSIILIVEDDDLQYEIYEEALSRHSLVRVKNGTEALSQISREPPDLLILDHVLSDGELGLDFLPEFKEVLPFVPIIIVSGALEYISRCGRCKARAAPIIACPSRWIFMNSNRPLKRPWPNAANARPCGNSKRWNVPDAWTRLNSSAARLID